MHAFSARHISPAGGLEAWPGALARMGLIVLSVDHATEHELLAMTPPDTARFYVDRVAMPSPCNVANLARIETGLEQAAANLLPGSPLDAVLFSCTSGSVVMGPQRVRECIAAHHPEAVVSTPITAAVSAFERLACRRLAVLTPYIDEVNAHIHDYLVAQGCEIVAFDSFHLEIDRDMSSVPPRAIHDAALGVDCDPADAIFICCTALRPSGVIEAIERASGKPVVTSHQAMLWDALRRSGKAPAGMPGFGRLLRTVPDTPAPA